MRNRSSGKTTRIYSRRLARICFRTAFLAEPDPKRTTSLRSGKTRTSVPGDDEIAAVIVIMEAISSLTGTWAEDSMYVSASGLDPLLAGVVTMNGIPLLGEANQVRGQRASF